jgi:ribosomal protein S18 acetylase RimI-like enzyme
MIRGYRPADLAALREICLLTGDGGRDATGRWSSDDLLPDVFLEPYVTLEPSTAWVVELHDRPVGYLVATLDTAAFADRWREEWSPVFAVRHARTADDPNEQWLRDAGYNPDWMLGPQVEAFPAHLHIDLLPVAQGSGWGRGLMRELGRAAVAVGVPGIHLAMARENGRALAFYERLGFRELAVVGDTLVLGTHPAALI